ncbi:hypothetical protein SAY87_014254 [Trapa incisa]|uniref:Uncharacterized protein n=1 Tax=Trapa incisa TaxID=236973 RepID=A0AAN7JLE4_9MYRT|nr:hypothetical protein SAY87_014254 [Trapa incisa]
MVGSPVSRLAAVAFGAGITLNALRNLVGSPIKFLPPTPKVSDMSAPETVPPNTVSYVTDISKGDRFLMVVFGLDRSMDN